jgi:hypothetical protein
MIFEIPIASRTNPMKVQNPKGEPPRNGPERMKLKKLNATMPPPMMLKRTPFAMARCLWTSSECGIGAE